MRFMILVLVLLVCNLGCGEKPNRKSTSPAKGKVTVDGIAPGSGVQVQCHSTAAPDEAHPTFSATETDADGNFSISTYTTGDGLPAGEYKLTFAWQEFNIISRSYSGEDKLKERYSDPETSTFRITVKDGDNVDLGVFDLTTK